MTSASKLLPSDAEALALSEDEDTRGLMRRAAVLRDHGFGSRVTYSRKVFIPLTRLCRDSCHYCTFTQAPRRGEQIYMSPEGTLMNESISRAAGAGHGEELPPERVDSIIASLGRQPSNGRRSTRARPRSSNVHRTRVRRCQQ